jgi:hypothetical protein
MEVANENFNGHKLLERADELEDQRARSHERGETKVRPTTLNIND